MRCKVSNQNTINVDSIIADKTLSVQEKFEQLIALDFPNRKKLNDYKIDSVINPEDRGFLTFAVFCFTMTFLLWCLVLFLFDPLSNVSVRFAYFVAMLSMTVIPIISIVSVIEKGVYLDKKLFRGFFFKWKNGKNAFNQWEKEEQNYQKIIEFLNEKVGSFSVNELQFLSTCKMVPNWVNQWATERYSADKEVHEKDLESKQLNALLKGTKTVNVEILSNITTEFLEEEMKSSNNSRKI